MIGGRANVDLWQVDLDADPDWHSGTLGSCLSQDEQARARRFAHGAARRRFISRREVLRHVLARRCGIAPLDVSFHRDRHGKPSLAGRRDVRFNLAHSGNVAFIGMSSGAAIGVDVERIRRDIDVDRIARRFFSEHESRSIATLPHDVKARAFFRCWAQKEAFAKATGVGFRAFRDIELGFDGEPAHPSDDEHGWTFVEPSFLPELAWAVAVRAAGAVISIREDWAV
jgi:4'-phosphopantetheinyl transferase